MANSSVNNGNQTITFAYQQEGTAQGFNKILHGVLPRGIISGGALTKHSNTEVYIAPMQLLIGDDNVTAHVETSENATVTGVGASTPYIVATYTWENLTNSYVNFQAMGQSDIPENAVILGKGVFTGTTLNNTFDYTKKSWTSSHRNNDFGWSNSYNTSSPSFNVIPDDTLTQDVFQLYIERGEGIIGGKLVTNSNTKLSLTLQTTSPSSDNYFATTVTSTSRTDIVVMESNGIPRYIMGADDGSGNPPICPTNALVLAYLSFEQGSYLYISGDKITNVFNNHFYSGSPTVGRQVGNTITHPHTLFL